MDTKNIKIGFSFSGGGARAIAHMGAIKALRENGLEADVVAGTSGGAIVGALYAAGIPVEQMLELASKGSLLKLVSFGLPINGLTNLDYLGELLDKYIGSDSFEDLKIPLSVAAVNLRTGKKRFFNSGKLYPAVMASSAVPLVFKPIEIDGELYADGGLIDNLPVEPLLQSSNFLIGLNVVPQVSVTEDKIDDLYSIGTRVFDISIAAASKVNFKHFDIIIEPEGIHEYGIFSFSSYQKIFDLGYQSTQKQIEKIMTAI